MFSMKHGVPEAPDYNNLPAAEYRAARKSPGRCSITASVEVVTPILGGGVKTRSLDDVDVIRPATIRGHLRFWWRALKGHEFPSPQDLYRAESSLWGRAATDDGGRSAVEIRIEVKSAGNVDGTDVGPATPGAYALWPARSQTDGTPAAPRRQPGTQFGLTLIGPQHYEAELRSTVRAWLLFGGYGGRTRRGLGSFKVLDGPDGWLPTEPTRDAFTSLFGRDVFAPIEAAAGDVPWLAGASLQVGKATQDAMRAWIAALDWLKEFRQGTAGSRGDRAREPGTGKLQPNRPSVSNWPEADKIRHLRGKLVAHRPRHNDTPAWPRAGFGLPIVGRFQNRARNGGHLDEPGGFELHWRRGEEPPFDRLASPLTVKAMPLANGHFVPCALWLNRAYPENGEVVLKSVPNSQAPFDRLVAPDDTPRFSAIAGKGSLREAFLDWLVNAKDTTKVAP